MRSLKVSLRVTSFFDILNMLNIFYCITLYVYFRFSVLRGRLRRVPWVWGNSFASLEVCLWKSQGCIFCFWKSQGCIFWGFLHLPSDMCHKPCDKEVLSTLCIGLGVWYKYDIKICNPRNWRLRQFVGTRPTTTSLLLVLDLVRFLFSFCWECFYIHIQSHNPFCRVIQIDVSLQ